MRGRFTCIIDPLGVVVAQREHGEAVKSIGSKSSLAHIKPHTVRHNSNKRQVLT
jgi:hypothetical protein